MYVKSQLFSSRLSTILFSEAASFAQHGLFILAVACGAANARHQNARLGHAPSARDIRSRHGQFTLTIIFRLDIFFFQFNPPSLRASAINSSIARMLLDQEEPSAALVDLQAIEDFVAAQKTSLVKAIEASAKQIEENAGGDAIDGEKRRLNLQRYFL